MKAMSSILMVWLTFSGLVMALLTPAHAAVDERVKEARQAYADGEYEKARNGFSKLLNDEESRVPRDELSYSLGAVELKLGDESKAVKAFSQSLQSPNPQLQLGSLRALGNVLYEKGKKEREVATKALKERKQKSADEAINRTLKDWEDALAHLGTALQLEPGHEETHQNYDFVKKQLEDLKKEAEQRKQQQQQQQQQQGQKGQEGEQQGDPSEENQGEEGSQPQGENAENQDRDPKQQDAMQEGEQEVPEGQVSAGDGEQGEEKEQEGQNGHQPQGQQQQQQANGKPQDGEQDAKRNEETGFTPMEARSQLRNYADDENSVQYLMRREQPLGGKDY